MLIPGIGAFLVRARWRRFRSSCMEAAAFPLPDYGVLRDQKSGEYQFFGTIGALGEDGRVWIDDGNISVRVDLRNTPIYLMGSVTSMEQYIPDLVSWKSIQTIPEGTKIYVAGYLEISDQGALFCSRPDRGLLAALYDGPSRELLIRAVQNGRERNEYWNTLTPISLTAGSFLLFIYFYLLLGNPLLRFPALLALTISLLPVSPFLPPATLGYSVYRNLWGRARAHRATRDLLRLSCLADPVPEEGSPEIVKVDSVDQARNRYPEALSLVPAEYTGSVLVMERLSAPALPQLILPVSPGELAVKRQREAIRLELTSLAILAGSSMGELLFLFALFAAVIR